MNDAAEQFDVFQEAKDETRQAEITTKVDGWILDATLYVVEQYRTEVGQFIADTVRAWDPEDTSRKIELAVGRDLQFIRINGTLMGAVVGLLLYLVGRAL